jgi:hypothetical protein
MRVFPCVGCVFFCFLVVTADQPGWGQQPGRAHVRGGLERQPRELHDRRAGVYVCVYVCMYDVCTCVYVRTYVCTYVCKHVCTYACMCVRGGLERQPCELHDRRADVYVCVYVCMYVYMCSRVHVRTYVCMYVCMHVCVYACTCIK